MTATLFPGRRDGRKPRTPRLIVRGIRRNLYQRAALIATGLFGSPRAVETSYGRARDRVALSDMHNADFWFDQAAATILDWYATADRMGHLNFHGTEWEEEAHYPNGKHDGAEPVWDEVVAAQILVDLRSDLLEDPFSPFEPIDFDYVDSEALSQAFAEEKAIEARKQRARERFASLLPALWD